jgi:pyruvate carboxylase
MAGLLTPAASRVLISALRKEFPAVPIHVHTHDSSNSGVAAMIACLESGADVVDAANDAMSGLTSQPAMGAIAYHFKGSKLDTGIDIGEMQHLTDYWELIRLQYEPFDSGQKSAGSDVWTHEIPGETSCFEMVFFLKLVFRTKC